MNTELTITHLGRIDYPTAWNMQKNLAAQRAANLIPNTLLLLEHPPTFTLGRSGKREHLLVDPATLRADHIALHSVDRGGDITYHGPGQLVGYPILALHEYGLDYHGYLRRLEEVIIRTLADFNQPAFREPGYTGVWVPADGPVRSAKIAAIGVKVDAAGITGHGFAVNLNTDLRYFDMIVPCGIRHCATAGLSAELGRPVDMAAFAAQLARVFAGLFSPILQKEAL